ncbi:MAG: DUF2953 domain-containing protein [Paracoccaceae bacterium]
MSLLLSVLFWGTVGLLSVLVLGLISPLRLMLHANSHPRPRCRIAIQPLGGACPPLRLLDTAKPRKKQKKQETQTPKRHKPRERKRWVPSPQGRAGKMLSEAPALLTGLLGRVRIERLALDAEFGLGDPAETGHLYGLMTPLLFSLPGRHTRPVSLRPNFEEATLRGHVETQLCVIPVTLARPLLRFGWRVWRAGS